LPAAAHPTQARVTAADTRPRIILVERRRGAQGRYGDIVDSSPNSIMAEPLGGRYQLGDVIGRGGMASVYTAKDLNLGRDVALKLFAPQSADPDELRRQEAEIELLATLNHPSLVTLFDAGTDTRIPNEPRPFLTMELVDGQDLRTRIRHSSLPLDELAVVGAGIADALAYVHALGIVHRDIKPANILLVPVRPGEPLRPKLTDFGIARIIDGTRLTATGTMVGTAAYLSPEQARGADLGPASDIYSLGLVLLECLKGQVEYPGSAVESAVARLHRAPAIPAEVPAEWARLIRAMTALDPLDRPSAAELEAALRYALVSPGSLPGPVKGVPTRVLPTPASRPRRRPRHGLAAPSATRPLNLPDPDGLPRRPRRRPSVSRPSRFSAGAAWFARARLRTRVAVVCAVMAVLAVGAAVTVSTPDAPDVVPYPAVTGPLGDHLKDLQKSVEP
jgi:serine/threonine protein kinase